MLWWFDSKFKHWIFWRTVKVRTSTPELGSPSMFVADFNSPPIVVDVRRRLHQSSFTRASKREGKRASKREGKRGVNGREAAAVLNERNSNFFFFFFFFHLSRRSSFKRRGQILALNRRNGRRALAGEDPDSS
ncbi:hypothetical protein HYC85_012833 [Camellia sinensis]|uniref:Uncharacterized protein n=1 Tax=Camellia sinensis TaxID=4442 RepID=A0A7J7HD42_CAMSI|nr:hypothetical protein HYC85_012833 [Camellia sinensis]